MQGLMRPRRMTLDSVAWPQSPHLTCVRATVKAAADCALARPVRMHSFSSALLATRRRHAVCASSPGTAFSFADALFSTQGLMAVMQPIICCVRGRSLHARFCDRVLSGGASKRGVAQS
jgi:hypothetical protein